MQIQPLKVCMNILEKNVTEVMHRKIFRLQILLITKSVLKCFTVKFQKLFQINI